MLKDYLQHVKGKYLSQDYCCTALLKVIKQINNFTFRCVECSRVKQFLFPVPLDTALILDKTKFFVNSWLPLASYNALSNGVDVKLRSVYNTENLLNMMPIKTAALTLVII